MSIWERFEQIEEACLAAPVGVWLLDPEVAAEGAQQLVGCLDDTERTRTTAFRFERDRLTFRVAHVFLRHVLSRYRPNVAPDAWRFDIGPFGRPEADAALGAGLRFSLSHTRGLVAVAVAQCMPVGVDVERTNHGLDLAALARVALAPSERVWFARLAPQRRADTFATLWTIKEAVLKACGVGIGTHLSQLEAVEDDGGDVVGVSCRASLGVGCGWWVASLPVSGGYRLAIATQEAFSTAWAIDLALIDLRESPKSDKRECAVQARWLPVSFEGAPRG